MADGEGAWRCRSGGSRWRGGDHKACGGSLSGFGCFRSLVAEVEGGGLLGKCVGIVREVVHSGLTRICVDCSWAWSGADPALEGCGRRRSHGGLHCWRVGKRLGRFFVQVVRGGCAAA